MLPFTFEAAIFDVDGTLLDSMELWHNVDRRFLARRGLTYTEEYSKQMAALYYDLAARYTIELFGLDETPEQVKMEWDALARDAYLNEVTEIPGARAYLETLRRNGVRLAYATSGNDYLTVPALQAHGLYELFDACAYTKETGKDKSSPDVYLLAAERLNVKPEACVVFEDVPRCIRGAKLGGFRVVAVHAGAQDPTELAALADWTMKDYTEEL